MASTRLALLRHKVTPTFRRNPRVFPPAKSKLLRVREPRVSDPVETELLSKWWSDYKLQMAAVVETGASESCRVCEKAFDEDLITINEKWNSDTKLGREYYYVEHFNRKIAELLQKREEYDKKEAQRMEILKAKLLSVEGCDKQMVTRENIDERLDEIMSSPPVQFNYSVSERGKTIHPESLGDLPSYVHPLPSFLDFDAELHGKTGYANRQ
ncbi:hypothetical protein ECG_04833 [Echinococcus granulosus]|nr:hypothetical protein ECG_04833 [Echinococcus granulosus]